MKRFLSILVLCLAALGPAHRCAAQAATADGRVYLRLNGPNGEIRGEIVQKGREGWHEVLAFTHEVFSPRDPASGQATGKRQHLPFKVVKRINRATPALFQALVKNEMLKSVEIAIWGVSQRTGVEELLLTYTLVNASVASVRPWMPNKSDPAASQYAPAEEVAFVYHRIDINYHPEGLTSSDSLTASPTTEP